MWWGSTKFVLLTSDTYNTYTQGIPISDPPQTFRQAVELTRLLGYKYLWIDSLYILQDSHEDWTNESSMMGEIYAHCLLNMAATAFADGNGGLFDQPANLLISPCLLESWDESENMEHFSLYLVNVWQNGVEDTALGKRGWVIQERILSPRVVHFASNQIFWQCCTLKSAGLLPVEVVDEDDELKKVAPYPRQL